MTKDFLADLLDSPVGARVLRLFIFNREECFTINDITKRAKASKPAAQIELRILEKSGLIKKKKCLREVGAGKQKNQKTKKKWESGWSANENSPHLEATAVFLRSISPTSHDDLAKKLRGVSGMRLLVTAGVLCGDSERRVDLLVVGDKINERQLRGALGALEADLGHEVRYAAFPSDEFQYRLDVYDKLIRDVFDYPHRIIVDRIDIEMALGR